MITKEQLEKDLQEVDRHFDKNERLSWARKKKKIDGLIAKIQPIENKILELMAEKQPILDDLVELRKEMVKTCVHSEEFLVHCENYIECKFCNRKIKLNKKSIEN